MKQIKNFNPSIEWKSKVPDIIYEEHPEYIQLYWKAWELAHDHIKDVPNLPQTPYMDEAASPINIWIWDTCFMALFCKYGNSRFPGVESLNNFYGLLYDGKKFPLIKNEETGEMSQFALHIVDNPPLFAWTEYENFQTSGDIDRIKDILLNKQYLQKHFDYLENLSQDGTTMPMVAAVTRWRTHEKGYFWEGGRSGMDNTPRGRKFAPTEVNRPDNKHILWIDAIAQQALSALYIARLAKILGEEDLVTTWMAKYEKIKTTINTYYWDEEDGFYYDIVADTGEFVKVMTPASYWVMLAEVAPQDRANRMVKYLLDSNKLGGMVPCVTLSRDDIDFNAEHGLYWRGAMWVPTAYMTIKALEKYQMLEVATQLSKTILEHMSQTFLNYEPHTIWECYAPNSFEPARSCVPSRRVVRKDFCGWSALAPISMFIENIIGISTVDAYNKVVYWNVPKDVKGTIGVKNYTFGDIQADFIFENNSFTINSDGEFTLFINNQEFLIAKGNNSIQI
jgi:glycogen debranching enzyme